MAWSPEQIAHRIRLDFADDESMRISHRRSTRRSMFKAAARYGVS
jgi:hypothetical protein